MRLLLGLLALAHVRAFTRLPHVTLRQPQHRRQLSSRLRGLQEWLGETANYDGNESAEKKRKRPLCVLPFEIPELLMPGQTRYLHFYESRFVKLGEKAQNEHHGIVALAFFSGSEGAMLRVCTLCQIDEYTKLDVGIGLTVRGVGRCNIDDITGMSDIIEADVTLFEDEDEDETEEGMPGHDGRIAQLGEVVFKLSDNLSEGGKEAGIDVSAKELDSDPRSILQSGETLEQAVRRMEQAAAEQQQQQQQDGGAAAAAGASEKKKRGAKGAGGGGGGGGGGAGASNAAKKDGVGDAGDEMPSLRRRVALARAVQTRSISAGPRDASEQRLEMELASFLGLEGAPIQTKLKAFLSQDLGARMELAADALEERSKMLSARRSLMNLNLGTSSGKAESSDDLDLDSV